MDRKNDRGGRMNQIDKLKLVEQFSRKSDLAVGQTKITRVSDFISVYIETIGDIGHSVYLDEYKVDGMTYNAGYSSRSDTLYISQTS
ncbi:MAG: hypothetical protein CVU46_08095 [Chloroflexi bacterium HGW-Chloroflexi-8]|jgi:hypothetical protein|nr:MAG: hypothetical protein CVU46_08095 [Chloroflexi bacterium HGW-Chloroflexi-8]